VLFRSTAIPKSQLQEGAVSDASVLHGQVALNDIYPGQQLTIAEFGATEAAGALSGSPDLEGAGKQTGTWRAVSLALDSTHGISPQVQTGDRVDVYAQVGGTLYLLRDNVLVLQAPNQTAANTTAPSSGNYILRVSTSEAPKFLFIGDNGKLYFTLRPQKNAKTPPQKIVTSGNVMAGVGR